MRALTDQPFAVGLSVAAPPSLILPAPTLPGPAGRFVGRRAELVDLAHASGKPFAAVVTASAQLDAQVDLPWLARAIARLPASNRWQARARAQLANELRTLRQTLLQRDAAALQEILPGVRSVIDEVKRNAPQDLAMISASLAEIRLRCTA